MDNSYNLSQVWAPGQTNYSQLQLEQELEYNLSLGSGAGRQQQQQQYLQQPYANRDTFHFPPQQIPSNSNVDIHSSSLHGAFTPVNQQQTHSRTSSFGATQSTQQPPVPNNPGDYVHGIYGTQQGPINGQNANASPYRSTPSKFQGDASASTSLGAMDGNHGMLVASNYTASPAPQYQTFSQPANSQPYYRASTADHEPSAPPSKRRAHSQAFADEGGQEEQQNEAGPSDPREANKAKLARACARCKNLKVKCEAKTETEPCRRCFNGGHECVIPGRKIRRTPPKREHLLNQIHAQAKEIERLMMQLGKVNAASSSRVRTSNSDQIDTGSSANLHSPVLSPSSPSGSFFGSETPSNPENTSGNADIEAWLAKARESFSEFGSFIGIGGAGMPKSYLVEEDFEGPDSGDDDYVDVAEDLDGFGNGDDRYEVEIKDPDGEGMLHREAAGQTQDQIRHKSSASSLGTTATASGQIRKRGPGDGKRADLPVEASPFGLFGNLSLRGPRSRASSAERDDEDKGSGIANEDFFKTTSAPNALGHRLQSAQHQAPQILTRGVITPQEAEKLFEIYFDRMNLSVSLLDPVLYTAQRTFYRSPFLFTVICAIASRFYSERPGLYTRVMHFAQLAAGTALIGGIKNVEMCQAYILLSLYPVPAKKWEDQRSWLYLGLAIRVATDLNLHLPTTAKPLNENHAREMLNRTRVWLNCLNLDRSTGSQYGKPPIISPKDYIANHSEDWWQSSPHNMKHFDIHICAYNAELGVMAGFIAKIYTNPDHPTGLNKEVDFEGIATATDDDLKALGQKWFSVLEQTDMSDPQNCFRTGLLRLAYSYARLIALSYGFQHAFGKNNGTDENPFLMRCLSAASDVVNAVVHNICRPSQLHYFRHGPEAQSVFATFASAFLVKLLQPRFASYLAQEQRTEIRALVQKVIDLLGSPEIAIDDRHGPKLYSRFLEKLLARPMAQSNPMSPASATNVPLPQPAKVRSPKSASEQQAGGFPSHTTFEIPSTVFNHPSPSTTSSLSPPPTEAALSFDNFAPVGAIDPYGPTSATTQINGDPNDMNVMMSDYFQPPLPFDNDIIQSMQSLTDPSGWRDVTLPGFNWMAQFQQNLGLDLNNPEGYDDSLTYLT